MIILSLNLIQYISKKQKQSKMWCLYYIKKTKCRNAIFVTTILGGHSLLLPIGYNISTNVVWFLLSKQPLVFIPMFFKFERSPSFWLSSSHFKTFNSWFFKKNKNHNLRQVQFKTIFRSTYLWNSSKLKIFLLLTLYNK